jgi:hypothetical protein
MKGEEEPFQASRLETSRRDVSAPWTRWRAVPRSGKSSALQTAAVRDEKAEVQGVLGRRVGFHPGQHGQLGLRSNVVRSCAKLRPLYRMPIARTIGTAWVPREAGEVR